MSLRSARMRSMLRALPLLLLCAAAHAAEVAQFRADDFGAEWRAARGGTALAAVHPATNGWVAAFADRGGISFFVNGAPSGQTVSFGSRPRRYHPRVFQVELRLNGGSRALDRMWLVVNHPQTQPEFDQWFSTNTNDRRLHFLPSRCQTASNTMTSTT